MSNDEKLSIFFIVVAIRALSLGSIKRDHFEKNMTQKLYNMIKKEKLINMTFLEWLGTATKANGDPLSQRTIEHYYSGFEITSKEMLQEGVISKSLFEMNLNELDLAISLILNTPSFKTKDSVGKHMYSNALKRYRCYLYLNSDLGIQEEIEVAAIKEDMSITATEKETIIKARRGQGIYRDRLLEKYNHQCIMTQISLSQVLVASHIKPWAICNNQERIDVNNGLLLSATYDKLFDSGLITFTKDGRIKLSRLISKENAQKLNISNNVEYNIDYNVNMEKYIKYHNECIFVG